MSDVWQIRISVNNDEKKALLGDMNSQGTKKATAVFWNIFLSYFSEKNINTRPSGSSDITCLEWNNS